MAKRILQAQLRPCSCRLNTDVDMLATKPGLAMTPSKVKELTDRGIAVSLPNDKTFLDGGSTDWTVDAMFKRSADMCELWELEKNAQSKVLKAHKLDRKRYGE